MTNSDVVEQWREDARRDPEAFWAQAAQALPWEKPWQQVFRWEPPTFRWFIGAETNLAANALDRHVAAGRGTHPALVYASERGERRTISYAALLAEVEQVAAALRGSFI